MHTIRHFTLTGIVLGLALSIAAPFTAYAIGIPIGGMITAMYPCLGTGYAKGLIAQPPPRPPVPVIFMPTIFPFYLASHPGQFVLGLLGPVGGCTLIVDAPASILPVMTFYGTSL